MVDSMLRQTNGIVDSFLKGRSRVSGFSSRSGTGIDSSEPYELVIDKNLRSRRKRIQDNTREELTAVLERVENVNNTMTNLIKLNLNF